MRSWFALGLALTLCGLSGTNCEAGQGVFAKIHRAKINLIKRVLHIGQGSGRVVTSSSATTTYATPAYSAPVEYAPVEYSTPIEYSAPIEYSTPVEYSTPAVETTSN